MSKFLISLLLLVALGGSDISGKWSGTIESVNANGENRVRPALLILKQEGNKITGSGGPHEGEQYPINKGVLEGDKLTFEVEAEGTTMYADLKVEGDQITGQVKRQDGSNRTAKLSVKHVGEK